MKNETPFDPVPLLSQELTLPPAGVKAVVGLLAEGNTIPFIARYRKEATGELDEVQIRDISERNAYLVDMNDRRQTILASIADQDKLTPELEAAIRAADTKSALEDLYLPYRPKRRTRATIARERGLEPLSQQILGQADSGDPQGESAGLVDPDNGLPDQASVLAGARDIAAEVIAERADVRAMVRKNFFEQGQLAVEVASDKKDTPTKFEQYYDYHEAVSTIPSHRFLAVRRGEREEVLKARVEVDAEALCSSILRQADHRAQSPWAEQLDLAVRDSFQRLIAPSVETDVRVELKLRSDQAAVDVFASNLRNLLMAAPLGDKPVIGFDPGMRTGCKVAALDSTGKFLINTTLYLARSQAERDKARLEVLALLEKHKPAALAVGNGTGGRETEQFLRQVKKDIAKDATGPVVQVNEAGASVYSASTLAREEFPDQDVTVRGAISIARRLQDPLAELVKIDPKAIGVGQYQHDVHQPMLARKLDEVVESCVNQVGVELNTASAPLMARVAGIGPTMAKKIVAHRDQSGAFVSRKALLDVAGLGPRTFEQAAGFIRIREAKHPLDASAVHPERYKLVEQMAADLKVPLSELIGNKTLVDGIQIDRYVSDQVGEPTLRDILAELTKPGRDPRDSFDPVQFREDVNSVEDLEVGMSLEGVVTNVTNFGAFVDVGVHRDGLVHISQLADKFVDDPHKVVKVGDRLKVRVMEVDVNRDRISLTARKEDAPPRRPQGEQGAKDRPASRNASGRGRPRPGGKNKRPPNRGGKRPPPQKQDKNAGDNAKLTHNPFAALLKKD